MARKRGKRMSEKERKAMFARLEKGKSRVGKARKVRTTSNTFVYKKAGDEFVFQNKSKEGNNDYDITKTLDRDEAKGFLKDVLGSEMSLRQVDEDTYFKKIPMEKGGRWVRDIVPIDALGVERLKSQADLYAVKEDGKHIDFAVNAKNPHVKDFLERDASKEYYDRGLGEFFERNKDDIIAYHKLMLDNDLHGSFIDGQLIGHAKNGSVGGVYVDDRVPFKGHRKLSEILGRIEAREKKKVSPRAIGDSISKDVAKMKRALEEKAEKRGLYENFGQKEVRKLEDKYHYNDLVYGSTEERAAADSIRVFDKWASTYNGKKKDKTSPRAEFKVGDTVRISRNDNENYARFHGKTLVVTAVAENKREHPGYDDSVAGQGLYDLKTEKGKSVPFCLYDYELERA